MLYFSVEQLGVFVDISDCGVVQSRTENIATEGDCVDLMQRSIAVHGRDWPCGRNAEAEAACDQLVVSETDGLYCHIESGLRFIV